MESFFIQEQILYDGSQLSPHWSFRTWGVQGDSLVCFRGPCQVRFDQMVDLEDLLKQSPIYSPDMLHIIIEHFDCDLEKTICRQRLLICLIKEILEAKEIKITRTGDDLYVGKNKLSISIATITPVSTMIHTGLNLKSNNVPVESVGLFELGWEDGPPLKSLAEQIGQAYVMEMQSIRKARCKVRGIS